jgi:hypothetical protein
MHHTIWPLTTNQIACCLHDRQFTPKLSLAPEIVFLGTDKKNEAGKHQGESLRSDHVSDSCFEHIAGGE